jgi:hypothetical protein
MSNLVPRRYRGVAIADVDFPLNPQELESRFVGREAYRRTEYIVVRRGEQTAVLRIRKASEDPLFSPITGVELLSGPGDTAFVHEPECDTAVPTQLAAVATSFAPSARCVVVQGRYEHVNLILEPAPFPLRVAEVVPPHPAKLVDQVQRVLDVAEDLPPVLVQPQIFDLVVLAARTPADHYLFPCRGSGLAVPGARVDYLDQRPPRSDWVLLGCRRSLEIHRHVYGDEPPFVQMCPRELASQSEAPTLTKCCLLEFGIERDGQLTVVPWGASLAEVREGIGAALQIAEPTWAPA